MTDRDEIVTNPTLSDVLAGMPGTRELLAELTAERDEARAAIARVQALTDEWQMGPGRDRTHAPGLCHRWHPDCLVMTIRAALEERHEHH